MNKESKQEKTNEKSKIREPWRTPYCRDPFARVEKDPSYVYHGFRWDIATQPHKIEDKEKEGWEIVTSTDPLTRDSRFVSSGDAGIPTPVTKVGDDGSQFLLMRIQKDKFKQLKKDLAKANRDRYIRSTKSSSVKKTQDADHIRGSEVNPYNTNDEGDY